MVGDDEADLAGRNSHVPIIHRHKCHDKRWVTSSITVQDPAMRKVLNEALHKYQDLDLKLEKWTFKPSFMSILHR